VSPLSTEPQPETPHCGEGEKRLAAERLAASRADPGQGAAALRAAREAGSHYRRDFAAEDQHRWEALAKERGLRLPQWFQGPEPKLMKRWLAKLGVPVASCLDWSGERNLRQFAERNESWGLRPRPWIWSAPSPTTWARPRSQCRRFQRAIT
jgi:hypothetical protein